MCCKERVIRELTEERKDLRERVRQMEDQLQELSNSLLQKERDAQVCMSLSQFDSDMFYWHDCKWYNIAKAQNV